MENLVKKLGFYKDKRVFITGHSGFKGTWLCKILTLVGADVYGYSLPLKDDGMKIFYDISEVDKQITSFWADIRDFKSLKQSFDKAKPEIVLHLAAQPLVLDSYNDPVYTYETNVMGTVNILECIRLSDTVVSFLNVTTDKVYENKEWDWGYRENEPLDGFDPYSNSKSCSELVTHSYQKSFFADSDISISTARAGNVIGGGDFADNRVIPDCVRAGIHSQSIKVRNPNSIRPYQHVLEPLMLYLTIAEKQYENKLFEGYYNVGPDDVDCVTTGELVNLFCHYWGDGLTWKNKSLDTPHEATLLKLDCSKVKRIFNWAPTWHIAEAIDKTVEWAKSFNNKENVPQCMENQIREFLS